jgi:hypothetical protein
MEPRLERAIRQGLLLYEAFVSGGDTAANERQQFGKSELGQQRRLDRRSATSSLLREADIFRVLLWHVSKVPRADMQERKATNLGTAQPLVCS